MVNKFGENNELLFLVEGWTKGHNPLIRADIYWNEDVSHKFVLGHHIVGQSSSYLDELVWIGQDLTAGLKSPFESWDFCCMHTWRRLLFITYYWVVRRRVLIHCLQQIYLSLLASYNLPCSTLFIKQGIHIRGTWSFQLDTFLPSWAPLYASSITKDGSGISVRKKAEC